MEGLHHGKPDDQLFRFFLPPPQRAEPLRTTQHQRLRKLQLPFRQERREHVRLLRVRLQVTKGTSGRCPEPWQEPEVPALPASVSLRGTG